MPSIKTKIGAGGRVVIPAEYRKRLGVKPGEMLILTLREGELVVTTRSQAVQRAQALVREYVPKGRSLSEELLQERRDEVARG